MTSLDVVVGGTEYLVAGPAIVGGARAAKALAVSKAGQVAILQLTGNNVAVYSRWRSSWPPASSGRIAAPHRSARVPDAPADGPWAHHRVCRGAELLRLPRRTELLFTNAVMLGPAQ
jgi:hypothetical protein